MILRANTLATAAMPKRYRNMVFWNRMLTATLHAITKLMPDVHRPPYPNLLFGLVSPMLQSLSLRSATPEVHDRLPLLSQRGSEQLGSWLLEPASECRSTRVLVADDDPEVARKLWPKASRIRSRCHSPAPALELTTVWRRTRPFDLVVTDIAMPWMTAARDPCGQPPESARRSSWMTAPS